MCEWDKYSPSGMCCKPAVCVADSGDKGIGKVPTCEYHMGMARMLNWSVSAIGEVSLDKITI